ncbi:MAG: peptidoglycan DD-metalloendopeptidase family protein [Pseudomonadota bacterium]
MFPLPKTFVLYLITLAAWIYAPVVAEDLDDVQRELEEISQNLQKIENSLAKNLQDHEIIQQESAKLDREIGRLHKQLLKSKTGIQSNQKELYRLKQEKAELDKQFVEQRKQYRHQLQAAYSLHSQSKWKFLLSQNSLQNIGRNAVIYDYLHDAQHREISDTLELSKQVIINQQALSKQQQKLETLVQQQDAEQTMLIEMRAQKQKAETQLLSMIDKDKASLSEEQNKQKSLQKLLGKLEVEQAVTSIGKFSKNLGKLPWPLREKPNIRYGESKQGISGAASTGVTFNAQRGEEIHAIFPGTVVFADWFDHYGWLIIIDHGDEFMSLYAHAEGLYKNVGDYVTQGEMIAVVGDSGDTQRTQLYFEIRRQGTPVDPAKWCVRS